MPELTVMSPSRLRSRTRKLSSVTGYNTDCIQHFWGIELTEDNVEAEWNMKEDEVDEEFGPDRDYMMNRLMVKLATLGPGLTKNEEHVVEVETQDMNRQPLKVPVVNMVSGVNSTMTLDLEFSDQHKVTFRLIAGSGPVYLSGFCIQEHPDEEENSQEEFMYTETETTATDNNDESSELEEEEEVEEEEEEEIKTKSKGGIKRKTSSPSVKSKSKRSKLETKEESEEEESEEEEEEEEEEEMDTGSKKKKGRASFSPRPAKSPKGKAGKKTPEKKEKKKVKKAKAK